MFDEEPDENTCTICSKEYTEGHCLDCEDRIEELKKSKDYSKLMEISTYSEFDVERYMAIMSVAQLAEKESDKEIIDKITNFLCDMVFLNKYPNKTLFGEIESFGSLGFIEAGTFSYATSLFFFLPHWNKMFSKSNSVDALHRIVQQTDNSEVKLNCATALMRLEDERCIDLFEDISRLEDYRYRAHSLMALGMIWDLWAGIDAEMSTEIEEGEFDKIEWIALQKDRRLKIIIEAMTPVVIQGWASSGWQTEIHWAGAMSLGYLKDKLAFPILESLFDKYEKQWLWDEIVLAMGRLKDPRAEPYIKKFVSHVSDDDTEEDMAANMVKMMRGIDSDSNAQEAAEMLENLDDQYPSVEDSYHIDFSVLDGAQFVNSGGPLQDMFEGNVPGVPGFQDFIAQSDDDDDDDGDDDVYYAYDCDCGAVSKINGGTMQAYIDDDMMYECDDCECDIDPSFGWYPISLDEYIA